MSLSSKIEWTDATWNPTTGCDRISPGCDNCYALRMSARLKAMGVRKYNRDGNPETSGPGFGLQCHEKELVIPTIWKTSRMIFVDSMSDLFHKEVPLDFIEKVFNTIKETPQHIYQILTKRSQRLRDLSDSLEWHENIWMGVSIESQQYAFRVQHLKETSAKTKFISAEPLLGKITLDLDGIDWVIGGGESGPRFREMHRDWIAYIRDQCLDQNVPFFFKQWGGVHAKKNGRLLDGLEYSEMPANFKGLK